ncbi:dihydrofolate reductase family protein [Nocardioides kongjuensis]|uniref:Dihydrofolate reductase n=1 Tax=Nocardioides kongjuensis TaxID=349522 RepID=A0A852RQV9_9ACTN|nr:dihydrofolate reductase family protein [Nocardioides kongjuensis]NYD29012.1 dihydrofolate reductase [Nocardioides kongjuensis]
MRKVTYSMGVSLDGFVIGPDGEFAWTAPDEEVFGFSTEEVAGVGVHLLGRRLYEAMLVWETVDEMPGLGFSTGEFARRWRRIPKVVFSTTLAEVEGNARLLPGGLVDEVERLRAEPGEGDIAVGGADLAAQLLDAGLVDEFRIRVYPVLVGGGTPYFLRDERRVDLELVETRTFGCGVVFLHHRVVR